MRRKTNRQAELRERRKAAGWVEVPLWMPADRIAEIRAVVRELVGKPPSARKPAARSNAALKKDGAEP